MIDHLDFQIPDFFYRNMLATCQLLVSEAEISEGLYMLFQI